MRLREVWQIAAPPVVAGIACGLTHLVWGEPVVSLLAAMAGAMAGDLLRPAREPQGAPRRAVVPAGPAERDRGTLDLPAGAGRRLLERLPLGVLLVDREGQVRFMNAAALELFGRCPPGVFHAAALRAPKLLAGIEETRTAGAPSTVDFTLMRGTELHLRAHLRALAERPGRGERDAVVIVIEDLTQARITEQLYRDFVANASHELKTPLASITGLIETLQGHARDDPAASERFLGIMATQAERMRRLVNDMLSLNRIEQNERTPPRTPQCLSEIVEETVDAMRPIAEAAGIALTVDLPVEEVEVLGSREELAQVFQNLIDNAVKYGREGDRVRVAPVTGGQERRGMIGIAVADTGPGIARTHLPRLTERFYRVSVPRSRARGGTGLGLAIVKHVLSRHRGQLQIESEVGRGSTFTVWLPLAPQAAHREAAL